MGLRMFGVTRSHHRRFAYETHKHDPSRSRRRCSRHRRSSGRHCRRCRGAELHDEHEPVHHQCGNDAVHDDNTVDYDAEDPVPAAGLHRSPLSEYGQVRFELGIRLELGLSL